MDLSVTRRVDPLQASFPGLSDAMFSSAPTVPAMPSDAPSPPPALGYPGGSLTPALVKDASAFLPVTKTKLPRPRTPSSPGTPHGAFIDSAALPPQSNEQCLSPLVPTLWLGQSPLTQPKSRKLQPARHCLPTSATCHDPRAHPRVPALDTPSSIKWNKPRRICSSHLSIDTRS